MRGCRHARPDTLAPLAARLDGLGTTIFAEMSALALATGSVNLGQGFPDTDGPVEVAEAADRRDPRRAQPVPARPGHPGPAAGDRRAPAAVLRPRPLDPDTEVLVTTGATEAIAAALLGLVDPGDEVIALEPFYDSYAACIADGRRRAGCRSPCARRTSGSTSTGCAPRSPTRTRLILLNTPHNPTGTVLTRDELQAVAELAVEHDLLVVTDEVYEHLVYDGRAPCRSRRCPACASAR